MAAHSAIRAILERIYGERRGALAHERISRVLSHHRPAPATGKERFSEQDTVLITYGDSLKRPGEPPLQTLLDFAAAHLRDVFSIIHLLPFFPYSSDDGFSVIDYFEVRPDVGSWEQIRRLKDHFDLMFDFVLNHISSQSPWFRNYLEDRPGFSGFALEVDPAIDLSRVTRPRAHPLLTAFQKSDGRTVHLWTTFSPDQIDLNFDSLDVLEKMTEVLLFYAARGVRILRLDAIAYLWKEIGTTCVHRPQAHDLVRLFRAILDRIDPGILILTETNVPHRENIRYFGNGADEAQIIYNFTLPPLLLHTFQCADATVFSEWADGLKAPSPETTFLNFTASHDGIGVRPLEGILPDGRIEELVRTVVENGGRVSRKENPDGTHSPYELNITYIDALRTGAEEPAEITARRFLASQAVACMLPGVPATYIHSLLGSRNWYEGVETTGRPRSINREVLEIEAVLSHLRRPTAFRSLIFDAYRHLLRTRRQQPAFHPNAGSKVFDVGNTVFGLKRSSHRQEITALVNVSLLPRTVSLPQEIGRGMMKDLLSGRTFSADHIHLSPYDYLWLVAKRGDV